MNTSIVPIGPRLAKSPTLKVERPLLLAELPPSGEFGRRQLLLVPISMIENWEHNPHVRTESMSLRELQTRFSKKIGQLVPCSAVSHEIDGTTWFRLMDGHRRKILAEEAGIPTMEVIHYPEVGIRGERFGKLFDIQNGGVRLLNMRERTGLALDGERSAAGTQGIKYADQATENLNEEGLAVFRSANQPNSALAQSRATYKELMSRALVENNTKAKRKFVSDCFVWQIKFAQQRKLIALMKSVHIAAGKGAAAKATRLCKRLLAYIAEGQPIPDEIALVPGETHKED